MARHEVTSFERAFEVTQIIGCGFHLRASTAEIQRSWRSNGGDKLGAEWRAACFPDLAVCGVAEQPDSPGGKLGRRLFADRLQMQNLAIKRKVVDPKIDCIGGAANLKLDRIA